MFLCYHGIIYNTMQQENQWIEGKHDAARFLLEWAPEKLFYLEPAHIERLDFLQIKYKVQTDNKILVQLLTSHEDTQQQLQLNGWNAAVGEKIATVAIPWPQDCVWNWCDDWTAIYNRSRDQCAVRVGWYQTFAALSEMLFFMKFTRRNNVVKEGRELSLDMSSHQQTVLVQRLVLYWGFIATDSINVFQLPKQFGNRTIKAIFHKSRRALRLIRNNSEYGYVQV